MAARVELELQVAVVAVHHSPSNEPSIFPGPKLGAQVPGRTWISKVGWLVGYITQRCFLSIYHLSR